MAINRNALKTYAPKARLDFIQAMKNRAALFGISKDAISEGQVQGEVYIVEGRAWPRHVADQRRRLVARIRQTSFDQVMEAVAYTWFNRFLAIRYMKLHDYFDHGFRVLSSPKGETEPQILTEAAHLDLPGLKRDEVIKLKLDGTQDEALYRKIVIAQCNDLNRAMPFLFEKIEDETELLLPENLLQSDSIVRKLVSEIAEAEWEQIEIIGWLYQFYISDKKDQVIGKVVKSEDIPAATQLFTPNWIVKYMVQNSLGATWLGTYPGSAIKSQMEYYIEPAEQTPEVNAQLAAIAPKSLDPEALTLIDPAVGSGHILVEAYDLFKAIYIERGYSAREAARLILTKNLYGLDIDDRAAQMAGFALLMKARADDRNLLRDPPFLNVRSLQESNGIDAEALIEVLLPKARVELMPSGDLLPETLAQPTLGFNTSADAGNRAALAIRGLLSTFKDAKTYGSLITVPLEVLASLPTIETLLERSAPSDLLRRSAYQEATETLCKLVEHVKTLVRKYDCVVANPPYMGSKGMNSSLKEFTQKYYENSKFDLFAAFIERSLGLCKENGHVGMITMHSWMFLSSFEALRVNITNNTIIASMAHLGAHGFDSVGGEIVSTTSFTIKKFANNKYKGKYFRLTSGNSESEKISKFKFAIFDNNCKFTFCTASLNFQQMPGKPIAYWVSERMLGVFNKSIPLSDIADVKHGLSTGKNSAVVRAWHEVSVGDFCANMASRTEALDSTFKWFPYNKGGEFRKWFGNFDYILRYDLFGNNLMATFSGHRHDGKSHYFLEGVTWTFISSSKFAARYTPSGFVFDVSGSSLFVQRPRIITAFLCTSICYEILSALNPTMNFQVGNLKSLPILTDKIFEISEKIDIISKKAIETSKHDWDSKEVSWDFTLNEIINKELKTLNLDDAYSITRSEWAQTTEMMRLIETENNSIFIEAYGLRGELEPSVPLDEITLSCNPHFRYGSDLPEAELEARLKSDTMRELISYSVGCMMGRYSLAEPGLIYAHTGNDGFDPSRYGTFPADADGIIPVTDEAWFDDDAAHRVEEFLGVAWPNSPVADNLAFLIDGLIKGHSDDPRGDLRDYLSKKFYPDHLQTYKNRPIYWLFSSGKLKAFECLVYLHRYNEGTLARMRTEYVTPLMGKMSARIEGLDSEIATSSSSSEKTAKTRIVTKLRKQLEELRTFDEELHHMADQRIPLDLDDGVKVNYGRFGNLLALKSKVCGKDDSE